MVERLSKELDVAGHKNLVSAVGLRLYNPSAEPAVETRGAYYMEAMSS